MSSDEVYADIRRGSWRSGHQITGIVEQRNFHRLLDRICRIYNAGYTALRWLFSGPQMHDVE